MKYKSGNKSVSEIDYAFFCILILLFLVYISHIGSIGIFSVLDDEFGYWGNAAYIAGLNWSDIVSRIPYYSYGYSLLLVPLFWIFDNPVYMYKTAIILNGIMLSACFLICYDISSNLSAGINKFNRVGISFFISMYPAYIVYSGIAWSECLLILVFWLVTWCIAGIEKEPRICRLISFGLLSSYLYIIHQRTVGILLASIIVIILMKVKKKIGLKHLVVFILPVVIVFTIHILCKENVQNNLWLNNLGNLTNDYTSQMAKIGQLLTLRGLGRALSVFIGQFYYLGVASYLIFYFGLYELIQKVWRVIVCLLLRKNTDVDVIYNNFYLHMFLLLSVLMTISISVIFMINPTRMDQIVYGRYTEIILGPILLIGVTRIGNGGILPWQRWFLIMSCFVTLTILADWIVIESNLRSFCPQNCVGLTFLTTGFQIYLPAILAILGFRIVNISFLNQKKAFAIGILLLTCLNFIKANTVIEWVTVSEQRQIEMLKLADSINAIEKPIPIHFLWAYPKINIDGKWDSNQGKSRYYAEYYQFLLKDNPIKLVDETQLTGMEGIQYLIAVGDNNPSVLREDLQYSMSAGSSHLFVRIK